MACSYKIGNIWVSEEELKEMLDKSALNINWWGEPEFKKRNPNFDHQAYLNSVNKFGINFENTPEYLKPKYDSGELKQLEGTEGSKASASTIAKVMEFLKRIGVNVRELDTKRYGGTNALASMLHALIEIADGKTDVAITEEAMHFALEILKHTGNPLYKDMLNRIGRYDIYETVKKQYSGDSKYQSKEGIPNVIKLKEEAIGKLLAEFYIKSEEGTTEKPELLLQTRNWWQKLADYIKNWLKIAGYNPFLSTISQLDKIGNVADINRAQLKEVAELIDTKDLPKGYKEQMDILMEQKNYRGVVSMFANQLEGAYQNVIDRMFEGDEELAKEIMALNSQFAQKSDEPDLFKEMDEMVNKYNLKLVNEENATSDEDVSSYYTVTIDGVESKRGDVDRTTDYAKRVNISKTGGKDYFKNPKEEDKRKWDKKAMEGIGGHADIAEIISSAIEDDGSLKPIGTFTLPQRQYVNKGIHDKLVKFLVGTEQAPGYLYTNFPVGSKFRVEQKVLNDKQKKFRAGTLDLVAVTPEGKVLIKDWKFMGFSLKTNVDIPKNKQSQHAFQLGDYKRTLKEAYKGIKDVEAETVPIHVEYAMDEEDLPYMKSITIGKANIQEETRVYLLPVTPEGQSSGNPKADELIKRLKAYHEQIYKQKVDDDKRIERDRDAKQLSVAIRSLQAKLDFEPISLEARNFEAIAEDFMVNMPSTLSLTFDQSKALIEQILPIKKAASVYADMEKYFTAVYGFENLDERSQKILDNINQASRKAEGIRDFLQGKLEEIWGKQAEEQRTGDILSAELEAKGILDKVTEASAVGIATVSILKRIITTAKGNTSDRIRKTVDDYQKLLASAGGNKVYDRLMDGKEHLLFDKNSEDFIKELRQAKELSDRKFFRNAVNYDAYKKIAAEYTERQLKLIEDKEKNNVYSVDEKTNAYQADFYRKKLNNSLNLEATTFDGYDDRIFNKFFWSNLKEDNEQLSLRYKGLSTEERALYDWIWEFNKRAYKAGYLSDRKYLRFVPLVTATNLQRIAQAGNKAAAIKSIGKDIYLSRWNEDIQMGIDPETGQQRRTIPTYYTSSDRPQEELSKDLNRIFTRYISEEMTFEMRTSLEDAALSLLEIERNKGHLERDKASGRIVLEGDILRVFEGNSINSKYLEEYINDVIYAVAENDDSVFDQAVNKFSKGTEEQKAKQKTNLKKIITSANTYVQQIAVGMKPFLITMPNYMGAGFQAIINSGTHYTGTEWGKKHIQVLSSTLPMQTRGAIDMFIPFNEDTAQNARRKYLWKNNKLENIKTWSYNDIMMRTNQLADKTHEITNAATIVENTIVHEGKFYNVYQFVKALPEYQDRYNHPETLKQVEKEMQERVKQLKKEKGIIEMGLYGEDGYFYIPGMDMEKSNYGEYRTKIIELGRNITSQMSSEDRFSARRDILSKSFLMFKNWIIKQAQLRALDIRFNPATEAWEYGRSRLYAKLLVQYVKGNIFKIRAIRQATPDGVKIMRDLLENKKMEYKLKTGKDLEITDAEFFDLVRKELNSEIKELRLLLSLATIVLWASSATPPPEADNFEKNQYKLMAKTIKKIADELKFYYNPLSFASMTQGSILPSLGILTRVEKAVNHFAQWSYYKATGNEEMAEKSHALMYILDLIPGISQFDKELLPIIDPEAAKNLGIKTTSQSRAFR